jgi:glycosyltransferase involved in cell wall biosynthesis
MKILHINQSYSPIGGTETYIRSVVSLLSNKGHQNIIIHNQTTSLVKPVTTEIIHQLTFDETFPYNLSSIIKKHKPDLAYLHTIYDPKIIRYIQNYLPTIGYIHSTFMVCPAMEKYLWRKEKICSTPFGMKCISNIYFERCSEARNPLTIMKLIKTTQNYINAYKQMSHILVGSRYMFDLLIQNGISNKRISIIPPHFIDHIPPFSPMPNVGRPIVLFVGRLSRVKGVRHLLHASARLSIANQFMFAGEGEDRIQLEILADQLNIADRISFTGWLEENELSKAYQNATLVIIPSIWPEPFGKVGIEAMAQSRPVVAYNVGGISDWLRDGFNGFLVPAGNIEALTIKIEQLLINRDLARRMGSNAYDFVTKSYSSDDYYKRFY